MDRFLSCVTKELQKAAAQRGLPFIFLVLLVSFCGCREQIDAAVLDRVSQVLGFPLPFFKEITDLFFVCLFVYVFVSVPTWTTFVLRKGVGSAGSGVRVECEPTNGVLGTELLSSWRTVCALTTEPSLHPQGSFLFPRPSTRLIPWRGKKGNLEKKDRSHFPF